MDGVSVGWFCNDLPKYLRIVPSETAISKPTRTPYQVFFRIASCSS